MKNKKRGFTLVELVIVIAVIAILAGVLIPTFSNLVENAEKNAAMQEAKNAYEVYLADEVVKAGYSDADMDLCIKSGDYYFHVTDAQFDPNGSKTDKDPCTFTKMVVNENGVLANR